LFCFVFLISPILLFAKTYYVDNLGNDLNSGQSIPFAFKTIPKAISVVQPGDVIYVRGGIHTYNSTIGITKSGTKTDTCFLVNFPGERPVLDFAPTSSGTKGINITGNYWHIKGFDIRQAGDNGLNISGGANNLVEFCSFYENEDSGVQLGSGAHANTFVNCDSYFNADPPDYGDADGFAPKLDVGTNNRFVGCRSWGNCDDGWDGYMRGATNVTTILENCWTWGNGYLKNGTDPGSQANGNGFKMGGGDNGNSEGLTHHFYLLNCLSFYNKGKGFDQNNNVGSMSMVNCTGYKDKIANYRIKQALATGQKLTLTNCVSFDGGVELGSFAVQKTNSWLSPFIVSANDFVSLDTTGISGARQSDGSLPDIAFMHLAAGSDLIDGGTYVGRAYFGQAPDLGAFEFAFSSSASLFSNRKEIRVKNGRVYPTLGTRIPTTIKLRLTNLNGQILFEKSEGPGTNSFSLPPLKRGVYLIEVTIGEERVLKKIAV
jgi:hypothetical protein